MRWDLDKNQNTLPETGAVDDNPSGIQMERHFVIKHLYRIPLLKFFTDHARFCRDKLQEREEYFRTIFENSPVGIAMVDFKTQRFTKANSSFLEILGYTETELLEKTVPDITHPEDWGLEQNRIRERLEGGPAGVNIVKRYIRKDGSIRWVHVKGDIIRHSGKKAALATALDITVNKEAEDALKVLAECSFNSGEEIFFSLVRQLAASMRVRYTLLARIRPDDPQTAHTIAVWSGGTFGENFSYPLDNTPCRNVTRQGPCFYPRDIKNLFPRDRLLVEMNAEGYWGTPLRDQSGGVIGILAILDDKPLAEQPQSFALLHSFAARASAELQRKRAEEEKEELQAQLIQALKMESVGRLAGGVAHDFNNMLSVILGNVEMAMEKIPMPEEPYKNLLEIQKAAERSADLTRQLLAFARKQAIAPRILNLNETVEGMLQMIRRLIGENIELNWLPGKNLPPVNADPTQIHQIITNLCVNSRDAIEGAGRITITTGVKILDGAFCLKHEGSSPGEFIQLSVSDDGTGMDKKTLENVFDPFFTTKEMGRGTGLGLATVYGIVKQNNGFIHIESDPKKGTTLAIYLPRHTGMNS